MNVPDNDTGLAIRFIRQYDPLTDLFLNRVNRMELVLMSCRWLGHTWRLNVGEPVCNICGVPNPAVGLDTPTGEEGA